MISMRKEHIFGHNLIELPLIRIVFSSYINTHVIWSTEKLREIQTGSYLRIEVVIIVFKAMA